jgi:hypothetical protein
MYKNEHEVTPILLRYKPVVRVIEGVAKQFKSCVNPQRCIAAPGSGSIWTLDSGLWPPINIHLNKIKQVARNKGLQNYILKKVITNYSLRNCNQRTNLHQKLFHISASLLPALIHIRFL